MKISKTQSKLITQPSSIKTDLNIFFTLSVELFCVWGKDGYFQELNPAWENLLGWTDAELRSRPGIEFVHPHDREATQNAALQCNPGEIIEYENRYCHKDGSYSWLFWRLFHSPGGFFYAIAKDITPTKELETALGDTTERRQTQADLEKAYQQLRLHVENSPLAVLEWDSEFRLQRWSQQAEKLFGWKAQEVIGLRPQDWQFIYNEDAQMVDRILISLLDGTKKCTVDENRNYTKDGAIVYCEWYNSVLVDESGNLVSILSLVQDITPRKQVEAALQAAMLELETRVKERTQQIAQANQQLQAEIAQHRQTGTALRQSEEQFRQVFDEAPIGMTLASLDDRYIRVNRAFCTMLGYTEAEIMALTFKDITHPEELELEIPHMQEVIEGESDSFQLEKRYIKKNGDILWVNLTLIPLRGQAGEILYTLAMIEDITRRKQALEALRQSEERYRGIVEDQTELICRFTPDGRLTFVNDAYCRYFSKQPSELIGNSFIPEIPAEDQELVTQNFCSLSTERSIVTYEHRVILPSGEIRWQQWTDRMMLDEQGNIMEFQAVGRDITKLKQAEVEIRKALAKERELSELRSSFVSLVSHEFRTPLTTILSSSELLERYNDKLSDEKKQTHHLRIQSAVRRMTQLLDDVLTIGKAEAGKLQFKPALLDLVGFCYEIVESMQMTVSHKHEFTFVTCGDCHNAHMDENLLRHVLTNLLSNAIKYSPQGGEVEFDLIGDGESATFRIQDRGIGMPPEYLNQLFNSFHRASNVGNIQGTGLGLAIVKKCVDLQGGTIEVESELGIGTTFTVTLPLRYHPQL
ncbi:MAG TPA: hypothetical protein DDZ80_28395 [Cyanobacteria bacterium UBA8803]|nr:hypothetical protein [Cyanobacteria bacterium UBA9273]HBL62181.1 hypothetical protein [Cyanobacteria bacterium UBA8803]